VSRWELFSRAASLLVAIGYLSVGIAAEGASALKAAPALLIPLALIWFSVPIGSMSGYVGHGRITVETPPALIACMGWFLLIGLPVLIGLLSRS
jgi:hypothetical protein